MSPDPESKKPANNPIDLSSLGFGPSWTSGPTESVKAGGGGRSSREDRDSRGPRPGGDRRGPRPDGDRRSGPRREGRREEQREAPRREAELMRPVVVAEFYPDDAKFEALGKAMRDSQVTYELFDVAKLILDKEDRLSIVIKPVNPEGKLWQSIPDGMPFLSEAEATSHIASRHLATFFDTTEVEVEAPKGNFHMVGRCPQTREILGAPNHHDWMRRIREHHSRYFSAMSFDRFKASIEMVREPEVVAAWIQSLSRQLHYVPKDRQEGEPEKLESLDAAKAFLLAHRRETAVRELPWVRFAGRLIAEMPVGPLRDSVLWLIEEQRLFPLSTANGIRGRLRKEGFHLYKRGSKGITYVCGVRRRCRDDRTTFSASMTRIFAELDKKPGMNASQLAARILTDKNNEEETKLAATDILFLIAQGFVAKLPNGTLHAQPVIQTAADAKKVADEDAAADKPGSEAEEGEAKA